MVCFVASSKYSTADKFPYHAERWPRLISGDLKEKGGINKTQTLKLTDFIKVFSHVRIKRSRRPVTPASHTYGVSSI